MFRWSLPMLVFAINPLEARRVGLHNLASSRRSGSSNVAQRNQEPLLEELMEASKPFLKDVLMTNRRLKLGLSGNSDEIDPSGSSVEPVFFMRSLRPERFAEVREASSGVRFNAMEAEDAAQARKQLHADFLKSMQGFKKIGAGGISGAQHFITEDKTLYLKTIPNSEVNILMGSFLEDYVEHLQRYPNSLLTRLFAVIEFQTSGFWADQKHWVLAMENGKKDIGATDSSVSFDLKGSKWKHRWKADGGIRCSPLFPLEFFQGKDVHTAEGEDIDFFALRTQLTSKWFTQKELELKVSTPSPWKNFTATQLQKYPWYEECAVHTKWNHGQKEKAEKRGKTFDFCKELKQQADMADVHLSTHTCEEALHQGDHAHSEAWHRFRQEEIMKLEDVRDFFGYPTPRGEDMSAKPLMVEPCVRRQLMDQIEADTNLLQRHELLDYSMDLVIKYDSELGSCDAIVDQPSGTPVFKQYNGGTRAVSSDGNPANAEKGVYIMQILDFLGHWGTAKFLSEQAQAVRAWNKVENNMPTVLKELVDGLGAPTCKSIRAKSVDSGPHFCWSNCGSKPSCAFTHKLANQSELQWHTLAQYNFLVYDSSLSCNSVFADRGSTARALCVAIPKSYSAPSLWILPIETPHAVPEPFKTRMEDHEIESLLDYNVAGTSVNEVMHANLLQKVSRDAPMSLKRIAAMAYMGFARKPYREDTVRPDQYAERFVRFFDAWIRAPSKTMWEQQCPVFDMNASNRCPRLVA